MFGFHFNINIWKLVALEYKRKRSVLNYCSGSSWFNQWSLYHVVCIQATRDAKNIADFSSSSGGKKII